MAGKRNSALRFGKLFDDSPEPTYAVGPDRRIIFFNPACAALTGWDADAVVGQECRHHGPGASDDAAGLAASLCPPADAFEGRRTRTQALLVRRDGERLWRSLHSLPVAKPNGELALILGFIGEAVEPEAKPSMPEAFAQLRERLYRRFGFDHIVAAAPFMQRVLNQVRWAAASRIPVLIHGEASTGKETLAQTIHYQGVAKEQPFMALDCEALPGNLIHKQLADLGFFARRAESRRMTVYFREPDHLPRELQLAIVEAVQSKPADESARLMAGMSRDPEATILQGALLDRLHHHLATLSIQVPALRNRREDVLPLTQQLIEHFNAANAKQFIGVHPEVMELLQSYRWPGNFAEFNSIVSELCSRASGSTIETSDLPHRIRASIALDRIPSRVAEKPLPLDSLLATMEKRLMELALRDAKGNKSKAAARLAISRARIHRRMQMLGITDVEPDAPLEIEVVEDPL